MNTQTVESKQATCRQRIRAHYKGRMASIKTLYTLYRQDPEASDPVEGTWTEFGLSFDYVPAKTFTDQRTGYFRFQLSWGGPSDEFRFYTDADLNLSRVEYRFMDWFDGAGLTVKGADLELIEEIWNDWQDCELPQSALRKARED